MNEHEKKLVEALRSGKYSQCKGILRRGYDFCCLGVACDLDDPTKWVLHQSFYNYTDGSEFVYFLPNSIQNKFLWTREDGQTIIPDRDSNYFLSLSILNYANFTFSQIADIIAANLVRKIDDSKELTVWLP